jgi:hypothetical protein
MAGDLRLYSVTVGTHKTRMRLNDHDAEALGDDAVPLVETPHPARPADPEVGAKNRLVTSNKMRGTDPATPSGTTGAVGR